MQPILFVSVLIYQGKGLESVWFILVQRGKPLGLFSENSGQYGKLVNHCNHAIVEV